MTLAQRTRNPWPYLVLIALFFAFSSSAPAAVLRVNLDAPGPARDGLSWPTAFLHPKDALGAAQPGDVIWVAEGVYLVPNGALMKPGVSLYGGFAGSETSRDPRDPRARETVLDGRGTALAILLAKEGVERDAVRGLPLAM
jgi:hypothetical protein